MITEEQRCRAYTINIAGFALMTPLGKIVLEYASLFKEMGLILFFLNVFISGILFIFGLTFVDHGRSILNERGK